MTHTDVLIVGAGPTGLVLAIWLAKQGISVRIVDKSAGPGESSRALAVQARTLELYRQADLDQAVIAGGYKMPAIHMWAKGERKAQIRFTDAGADISPYAFVLIYPQDKHERLLMERLAALGVKVERQTECVSFDDHDGQVVALLQTADGRQHTCTAAFLAGCDGARSPIRHQLGAGFEGGTYKQVFYVADIEAASVQPPGEGHIALDRSDFAFVLPYGRHRYRLIGTVQDERALHPEQLTFDDISHEAITGLQLQIDKVNWFSSYRVHHRVTGQFRCGRVFLLGDAAHVHSPAGGQGMNTGIADAINLAWKLAAVIKGRAPIGLLDSYEQERKAFAHKLVETTDRVFTLATAEGSFATFMRTRIVPLFASVAYEFEHVREFLFRILSQTTVNYPDSPLSAGKAGKVSGGDRLPFVRFDGRDNYACMANIGWQVHVAGSASDALRAWCERQHTPLHVFAWHAAFEQAGMARDAAYLLRPDGYVGIAAPGAEPEVLDAYLAQRGLRISAT